MASNSPLQDKEIPDEIAQILSDFSPSPILSDFDFDNDPTVTTMQAFDDLSTESQVSEVLSLTNSSQRFSVTPVDCQPTKQASMVLSRS